MSYALAAGGDRLGQRLGLLAEHLQQLARDGSGLAVADRLIVNAHDWYELAGRTGQKRFIRTKQVIVSEHGIAYRDALTRAQLEQKFARNAGEQPGVEWRRQRQAVLDAVREVSGRDGVRAEDDLIAFGISSIEATRLSALLRATTGIDVSLAELFSATSFGQLASTFEGRLGTPLPEIAPGSGRACRR